MARRRTQASFFRTRTDDIAGESHRVGAFRKVYPEVYPGDFCDFLEFGKWLF
jgi:hypothetical protein